MLSVIDPNIKKSIVRFGQTIKHYPSRLCSCLGENNGSPILNHGCNIGYYYLDPEIIKGIRTQVSFKYLNQPHGRIYNGGAIFTIPKFNIDDVEQKAWKIIAHGDILVLDNKTRRNTDILTRKVRDYLFAFDVTEVVSIYRNETKYVQGVDFHISENIIDVEGDQGDEQDMETEEGSGNVGSTAYEGLEYDSTKNWAGKTTSVTWLPGKGPADGETYVVEFICKQQFKVWADGGMDRGTDNEELPKKLVTVLRRFVNYEQSLIDEIEFKQKVFG